MKNIYKYKTNESVFIALSENNITEGIITRRKHIGKTPYYKFQFNKHTAMEYPEYRIGKTKEEAIANSNRFNNTLFN